MFVCCVRSKVFGEVKICTYILFICLILYKDPQELCSKQNLHFAARLPGFSGTPVRQICPVLKIEAFTDYSMKASYTISQVFLVAFVLMFISDYFTLPQISSFHCAADLSVGVDRTFGTHTCIGDRYFQA